MHASMIYLSDSLLASKHAGRASISSFVTTPRTSGLSTLSVQLRFSNSSAASYLLTKLSSDMRPIISELVSKNVIPCGSVITFSTKLRAVTSAGASITLGNSASGHKKDIIPTKGKPKLKTYNIYQASCSGKTRDRDIKAIKVPGLCCPASQKTLPKNSRDLLQSGTTVPSIARCPASSPELPLVGQCPYTTGMIVFVSDIYLIIGHSDTDYILIDKVTQFQLTFINHTPAEARSSIIPRLRPQPGPACSSVGFLFIYLLIRGHIIIMALWHYGMMA